MLVTIHALIRAPGMGDKDRYDFHYLFYFFLWNRRVQKVTPLKDTKFPMANAFQTKKSVLRPDGSMASRHTHTPTAQNMLISSDERLFIILIIIGIFQRGRIIDAISAILSIIN